MKPKPQEGVSSRNVIQRLLAAARRGSHRAAKVVDEGKQQTKEHRQAEQAESPQNIDEDDSAKTQKNAAASPQSINPPADLDALRSAAEQKAGADSPAKPRLSELDNVAADVNGGEISGAAIEKSITATPSSSGGDAAQAGAAREELAESEGAVQAQMQGTPKSSYKFIRLK